MFFFYSFMLVNIFKVFLSTALFCKYIGNWKWIVFSNCIQQLTESCQLLFNIKLLDKNPNNGYMDTWLFVKSVTYSWRTLPHLHNDSFLGCRPKHNHWSAEFFASPFFAFSDPFRSTPYTAINQGQLMIMYEFPNKFNALIFVYIKIIFTTNMQTPRKSCA